jgi:polyphosphate:AMP phosphotransferase
VKLALGKWKQSRMDVEMAHIEQLERMLTDDGHMVLKFWYHLSRKAQQKRFRGKSGRRVSKLERMFAKNYNAFQDASARAIRLTDTGNAPWNLIDAEDRRYRDLKTAKILLQFLTDCLGENAAGKKKSSRRDARVSEPLSGRTVLDIVDVASTLSDKDYDRELRSYQDQLYQLSWKAHRAERSLVAVFEGWDAAGKGGAIRRATAALDARLYSVISIAAPTDEERARHYLWRFWRHLPRDGYITLYDRSWYGRVLVERVEGFASQDEWMRAYQEINDFEEQLDLHGSRIVKFWVHITPDEQLRRFKERQKIEWKKHKITEEDWRNRQKWNDYAIAVTDMVARTSTAYAPWTLVPGNDKKVARVTVLKTLCESLESALDS